MAPDAGGAIGLNGSPLVEPQRPVVRERDEYVPLSAQETFIVPLLKQHIERWIGQCSRPGGGKVLDVGCGRQPFRPLLQAHGFRYFSLDTTPSEEKPIDFIACIDGQLPEGLVDCGPFDLILCTEVLEHVADWHRAFANLARLLGRPGRLILTCPFFYVLHEEPYDFWRPTIHAIAHYARRERLSVLHLERAGSTWDVLGTLLGSCRWEPRQGRVLGRALALLGRLAFGLLFRLAGWRWLREKSGVELRAPLYLCNIAVLEKDPDGDLRAGADCLPAPPVVEP